jgi:hypothetical protein
MMGGEGRKSLTGAVAGEQQVGVVQRGREMPQLVRMVVQVHAADDLIVLVILDAVQLRLTHDPPSPAVSSHAPFTQGVLRRGARVGFWLDAPG